MVSDFAHVLRKYLKKKELKLLKRVVCRVEFKIAIYLSLVEISKDELIFGHQMVAVTMLLSIIRSGRHLVTL